MGERGTRLIMARLSLLAVGQMLVEQTFQLHCVDVVANLPRGFRAFTGGNGAALRAARSSCVLFICLTRAYVLPGQLACLLEHKYTREFAARLDCKPAGWPAGQRPDPIGSDWCAALTRLISLTNKGRQGGGHEIRAVASWSVCVGSADCCSCRWVSASQFSGLAR